jgi:hypothetical protein
MKVTPGGSRGVGTGIRVFSALAIWTQGSDHSIPELY